MNHATLLSQKLTPNFTDCKFKNLPKSQSEVTEMVRKIDQEAVAIETRKQFLEDIFKESFVENGGERGIKTFLLFFYISNAKFIGSKLVWFLFFEHDFFFLVFRRVQARSSRCRGLSGNGHNRCSSVPESDKNTRQTHAKQQQQSLSS